jgi:hypothetical protein
VAYYVTDLKITLTALKRGFNIERFAICVEEIFAMHLQSGMSGKSACLLSQYAF